MVQQRGEFQWEHMQSAQQVLHGRVPSPPVPVYEDRKVLYWHLITSHGESFWPYIPHHEAFGCEFGKISLAHFLLELILAYSCWQLLSEGGVNPPLKMARYPGQASSSKVWDGAWRLLGRCD
eukprot:1147965-Pelagomonas_calceolata.AAC.8